MAINNKSNFHYNKAEKTNKNFMYSDLRRANCYNCNFSGSNFNFSSFRGAHFKDCDFFGCKFEGTEFVGSNLKKSKFKRAEFKNVIFEGVNLDGVDFSDAVFEKVIFLESDLSKVKNINYNDNNIKVYNEMPTVNLSEGLKNAILTSLENKYIRKSRVLDNKEGTINNLSIIRLLENFKEKDLISGLKIASERIDRDFSTLSYIIKAIQIYRREGLV